MQQLQAEGFPVANWIDRVPQLVGYGLPHAPIATDLAPCPILLCSPMGGGWRASLAEKAANLASHGFVVVVSDPCDAGVTVFPDGTYLKLPAASWPPRSDYLEDRVRDLAFILDELTRWNACDPLFAGRLDVTKVAALGTCSGFCCAAEFCRRDPRCQAAVLVACI
jgi:predicted dienelactone hydrolase